MLNLLFDSDSLIFVTQNAQLGYCTRTERSQYPVCKQLDSGYMTSDNIDHHVLTSINLLLSVV